MRNEGTEGWSLAQSHTAGVQALGEPSVTPHACCLPGLEEDSDPLAPTRTPSLDPFFPVKIGGFRECALQISGSDGEEGSLPSLLELQNQKQSGVGRQGLQPSLTESRAGPL